jgi:divalent metal cation (Fe/Co/Zn/Cd) transporter
MSGLPVVTPAPSRPTVVRGLRLAWLTIFWNVAEGLIAIVAGGAAGSAALVGFGLDSAVESASGVFALRRLSAGHSEVERAERRAQRGIALSLVALALWIGAHAVWTLARRERPDPTAVGILLPLISIGVMGWLARAKRRVAGELGSRALEADAFQTTTCFRLSVLTLIGIGLNAAAGLWWADPVAALIMIVPVLQEARSTWEGRPCACAPC